MKISEYTLLRDAFEESFGFMLNRIAEVYDLGTDFHQFTSLKADAEERCWNEFMVAIEELGIELQDVYVPLKVK